MKTIIVILTVVLAMFCVGWEVDATADTEVPSIHISEIEALKAVCCVRVEGSNLMCFFNHVKTLVIAYVYQQPRVISSYYYINEGELVAFKLDIKPFIATGRKDYVPEDLDEGSVKWHKKALDWMNSYPVFEPKPEPEKGPEYNL